MSFPAVRRADSVARRPVASKPSTSTSAPRAVRVHQAGWVADEKPGCGPAPGAGGHDRADDRHADGLTELPGRGGDGRGDAGLLAGHAGDGRVGDGRVDEAEADPEDDVGG